MNTDRTFDPTRQEDINATRRINVGPSTVRPASSTIRPASATVRPASSTIRSSAMMGGSVRSNSLATPDDNVDVYQNRNDHRTPFTNFIEKYKNDGIIWYFDNCELFLEELIRLLWKFDELGYFKYTKGIVWGRNGVEMTHTYNSMEETLKDSIVLKKINIPVIFDADISHKGPTMTIINGAIAEITCKNGKGSVKFELK